MSLPLIHSLLAHLAWADETVIQGLRTSPGSDPHALEQLAHVLGAEHVWLARLRAEPVSVAVWPSLTLDQAQSLARENRRGFEALLAELDEPALARDVPYVNSAGRAFRSRVVDILVHVAMHGAYHRGMISILTRRSNGTPAPTDYIAFIRGAPTATRADAPAGPTAP
jgi:uncharacterized damage-inducible protein DinB